VCVFLFHIFYIEAPEKVNQCVCVCVCVWIVSGVFEAQTPLVRLCHISIWLS